MKHTLVQNQRPKVRKHGCFLKKEMDFYSWLRWDDKLWGMICHACCHTICKRMCEFKNLYPS